MRELGAIRMDRKTKNEIVGRLWLWAQAVSMTQILLQQAARAENGKHQTFQINERDQYIKDLNKFAAEQPDYRPGTILSSQQNKFDAIYQRPFPTWMECFTLNEACIELAIVYFCQILNDGYESQGSSASNNKVFRESHLPRILDRVFEAGDLDKFQTLKKQLTTARDKMIGHADGDSYNIFHGDPISTMKGPSSSWIDIDFIFGDHFWKK